MPDVDISFARVALRDDLNDEGIDSQTTTLFFQPNVDTLALTATSFQSNGFVFDTNSGPNNWGALGGAATELDGATFQLPSRGFTSFTAIPEPSTLILGVVSMLVGVGYFRSRRA